MTFRVGQKVVCIDEWPRSTWRIAWDQFWHPYEHPIKGEIYTITRVYCCGSHEVARDLILDLAELPNRDDFWMDGFYACGFRPIVERKTDISALKALLVPGAKIRESADA